MSRKYLDIHIIGGHSPLILATVKNGGSPVEPPEVYGLEMYLARHGNTLDDSPKNGYILRFYYDKKLKKYLAVIPKKQSMEMRGHYVYQFAVTTPSGRLFLPEFGTWGVVQGLEDKNEV